MVVSSASLELTDDAAFHNENVTTLLPGGEFQAINLEFAAQHLF